MHLYRLLRLIDQTVQLEAGFVHDIAIAAVEKNVRLIESVRREVFEITGQRISVRFLVNRITNFGYVIVEFDVFGICLLYTSDAADE